MDFSPSFRLLEPADFHRGFLEVLNQLAPVKDFSEENFLKHYKEMVDQQKKVFVCEVDGRIVATATLLLERKFFFAGSYFGHVEDVVVDEKLRGKGLGRAIMKHLEQVARDNNCARMVLDCVDDKAEFYKKCGFYRKGNQMNLEIHQ